MNLLAIFIAVIVVAMAVMFFEMRRIPAGVQQESRIERGRIFSRTSAVTAATVEEAIQLMQTDWSWWKRARAETMKDLGNGIREFRFHPVCYLGLIQSPPTLSIRFERLEEIAGGGKRIAASITGDFEGKGEYSARPGSGGTIVELAWSDVEVRSALRFAPRPLVAAVHCWRERLGIEGLRDRLYAKRGRT